MRPVARKGTVGDLASLFLPNARRMLRLDQLLSVNPRIGDDAVAPAVDLAVRAPDLRAKDREVVRTDAQTVVVGRIVDKRVLERKARAGTLATIDHAVNHAVLDHDTNRLDVQVAIDDLRINHRIRDCQRARAGVVRQRCSCWDSRVSWSWEATAPRIRPTWYVRTCYRTTHRARWSWTR